MKQLPNPPPQVTRIYILDTTTTTTTHATTVERKIRKTLLPGTLEEVVGMVLVILVVAEVIFLGMVVVVKTHLGNNMVDEYNALIKNKTRDLVPRPHDVNVIRSMWIFRHKEKSDGSFERHKARLVGDGTGQHVGVDCGETFSPVVKPATIPTVLSLALSKEWPIHQPLCMSFAWGTQRNCIHSSTIRFQGP